MKKTINTTILGIFLAFLALAGPAAGQTRTWVGGVSGNWVGNGNWTPGPAQAGNNLVFPQTALNKTMSNNFVADTSFNSLVFNGSGYTVNGNGFSLVGGITTDLTGVTGGTDPVINAPVTIIGNQTFNTLNRTLTLNALTLGSNTLSFGGAGEAIINGNVTGTAGVLQKINNGRLTINGNSAGISHTLSGGFLRVVGTTGPIRLEGGKLQGTGTVGSVFSPSSNNQQAIAPGINAPGILSARGDITLTPSTDVEIDLMGIVPGNEHDRLIAIGGNITLNNSELELNLGGFTPAVGQTFTILQTSGSGQITGQFSTGNAVSKDGQLFSVTYNPQNVVLATAGPGELTDYGDAPASYGTLLADNGARHIQSAGVDIAQIGNSSDFELDGQPNAAATGDGADEDGVVISPMSPGQIASFRISKLSIDEIFVSCWIDFNRDGDFLDPNENNIVNQELNDRESVLFFNVPTGASPGVTYARCRATQPSQPSPSPIGVYMSGEVEDYQVTIGGIARKTPADFDGDGKTDLSIFRPTGGGGPNASEWWYQRSSNNSAPAFQFGVSTDLPTPGDFTGDGKTDVAFWRPSTGFWFVLRSEDSSFFAFPFGATGDIPVAADFDGDGKADAGIFRPSSATWFINKSSGGTTIQQFGASGDKPVAADFDGDGKADIAIFRPTGGGGPNASEWWIQRSSNNSVVAYQFGASTDRATPGDFTGDGKTDVAFWRPSTGFWFVLRSEDSSFFAFPFGATGDIPAPGDYDGDGKFDAAVFRPAGANWFANKSSGGTLIQQFGATGDIPVPSAFVP
jgi:hypothetical protein